MSNLKELYLYLTIQDRTTFIDGTYIYNDILVHMSRLHTFNFCFCTKISIDHLVHHLSKDDIQHTFTNKIYQQVDCIINYRYSTANCHVFSLPFMFDHLDFVSNTFPTIIFNNVRSLSVQDGIPFKHEFFIRITWSFPLLKKLSVVNFKPQLSISDKLNSNNNQLYSTIIEFPYLTSLDLGLVHIDYVEQFINHTKTYLPCLNKLTVDYDKLTIVTENFTRDRTQLNCMKIKQLIIAQILVHSKDFYIYFPLL
ncbi:unnamed protein product [Rotaria sp. Silwood2]|nr:unnamed protein product [Rotaria sp. Silwood2]